MLEPRRRGDDEMGHVVSSLDGRRSCLLYCNTSLCSTGPFGERGDRSRPERQLALTTFSSRWLDSRLIAKKKASNSEFQRV